MKIILRIIVSPAILTLILVTYNYKALRHFFGFMKYGGEWATYKNDELTTIQDIYNEIKSQRGK